MKNILKRKLIIIMLKNKYNYFFSGKQFKIISIYYFRCPRMWDS